MGKEKHTMVISGNMKNNYNDKAIKEIMKSAIVLIDTREQENTHITDWLDKKKIPYKSRKLDYGDYTLLIPTNIEYGIMHDMILSYSVERKANLEEISNNIANGRTAFENELIRGQAKMTILIEDASWSDIITHSYRTDYNEKAFIASLLSFYHRYDIALTFCEKQHTGEIIYKLLVYKLREELK